MLHPGKAYPSSNSLREKIAAMYKTTQENVVVYGMRTAFGGGRSSGFALVYDSVDALKKFEPKYRLVRIGLATRKQTTRKQRKERKNRAKKVNKKTEARKSKRQKE